MTSAPKTRWLPALPCQPVGVTPTLLEQLVKSTRREIWRLIAYLADVGSADDLTQETFLGAIGPLPRFAGRSSARTSLLFIARRFVVDQMSRSAPSACPCMQRRSAGQVFKDRTSSSGSSAWLVCQRTAESVDMGSTRRWPVR